MLIIYIFLQKKLAEKANRRRRTLWEADRESAKNFPSWFKKHVSKHDFSSISNACLY